MSAVRPTALAASTMLTGCAFAKDVLKAGVWVGVVAVVAVLLIVAAALGMVKHA